MLSNRKRTVRLLITGAVLVCMLAACGRKDSKETAAEDQVKQEDQVTQGTSTEKKDTVSENSDDTIPENSILNFNNDAGYARLQSDMKNGDYPLECNVLYDEGGERPDVTVTDEKVIREIYGLLADVTVGDKSDMSVTDMYHRVTFRLRNDTYVSFNFEGEDLFCWGQDNYDVENSSNLWYHVRQLQDAKMTAADTASSSENGQSEASAASKTSKSADASGAEASSMSKSSEVTYEQEAIDIPQEEVGMQSEEEEMAAESAEEAGGNNVDVEQLQAENAVKFPEPELVTGSGRAKSAKAENTDGSALNSGAQEDKKTGTAAGEVTGETDTNTSAQNGTAKDENAGDADTKKGTQDGTQTDTQNEAQTGTEAGNPAAEGEASGTAGDSRTTEAAAEADTEEAAAGDETAETAETAAEADTEQIAETAAEADTEESAAEADTAAAADTAAKAETAVEVDPAAAAQEAEMIHARDTAYTEIIRAYADILAVDKETFLEAFSEGFFQEGSDTADENDAFASLPDVDPRLNYEAAYDYFMNPGAFEVEYGLHDYNEDGIPELAIVLHNGEHLAVREIYTFDGDKAVRLFDGKLALAYRVDLFLLPDKTFLVHGSGGASAGNDTICSIASDRSGLEIIAEYAYDEATNGNMDHISPDGETLTDEEFREQYGNTSNPADGLELEPLTADVEIVTKTAAPSEE